jgi:hypothetical protein
MFGNARTASESETETIKEDHKTDISRRQPDVALKARRQADINPTPNPTPSRNAKTDIR